MLHKIPMRYRLSLLGCLLALGAPAGWYILSYFVPIKDYTFYLYLYQLLGTLLVFGLFGYVLGNFQDGLLKVLDKDHLTALLNQKSFLRKMKERHVIGTRFGDNMVVMMMDIDHFKKVNDEHNHLLGSRVLQDISKIIKDNLRSTDLASRYGGDEFAICLPRTKLQEGIDAAERIRSVIENTTFQWENHKVKVTTSIGLFSAACEPTQKMSELIEKADAALYQAKNSGRNKVVNYV